MTYDYTVLVRLTNSTLYMDSNPLPGWMLTERMRAETRRRAERKFYFFRFAAALKAAILPTAIIVVLIGCVLAASYGDMLSGINPSI